ncbi:MAG: LLM class flavin-dependent oxidoreductase [bacterium]|nr:LLM class flavin-dependent oxidoreductase [bacterium]
MGRIGIQIGASTPPSQLVTIARLAEQLDYGEMWFAEDYFELGGIASVATALGATERIPVGLGVVAARVRHPAVAAMELATLGGAHPGRLIAGLGHGAPGWMQQMGLEPESPMGLLREATTAIRRLLDGDSVAEDGVYFKLRDVHLDHPPATRIPLYYGVQGPSSLRLSGELADGTLLGWFSSPGSVAWARERVNEGRTRAGRQGRHKIVALCVLSISSEDPGEVSRTFARWSAPMLQAATRSRSMSSSAEGEELSGWVEKVGEDLGDKIPLELLRRFAAVGSPDDCARTVSNLLQAGADRVVLVPNPASYRPTAEMVEQMKLAQSILE